MTRRLSRVASTDPAIHATLEARARELVDPERPWDDAKTFAHHYLQERHRNYARAADGAITLTADDLEAAIACIRQDVRRHVATTPERLLQRLRAPHTEAR